MTSHITQKFREAFNRLPKTIKKQAKETFRLFNQNPYHPSFHFKRIHSTRPIFSLRITKDCRAVGIQQNNQVIWFWIGSHNDYDNLLKQIRPAGKKFF